jgi:hypothetical protein
VGREFWYQFDNKMLWRRLPAVDEAINRAYFQNGFQSLDGPADVFRRSFEEPDHPRLFIDRVAPGRDGFLDLARLQLEVIETHLTDDDAIRRAFEDFGQGVLYDDRPPRPTGFHVHMMDGTPANWVGWQRWNANIRASQELGANSNRWSHINRCVGLAWAIQTEANPIQDNSTNAGLPSVRLDRLSSVWMNLETPTLDWAFATHRFTAPSPEELESHLRITGRQPELRILGAGNGHTTYTEIQDILERAAGPSADPIHDGQGRFWLLPYAAFMALPPIYGNQVIAAPGPDRGEKSALIKILRGTLTNFPRMPKDRPPMAEQDIEIIRNWVDAGCPEM